MKGNFIGAAALAVALLGCSNSNREAVPPPAVETPQTAQVRARTQEVRAEAFKRNQELRMRTGRQR